MARVVPFRGVVYSPSKIQDLADVTAPPYDVISPEDQTAFYNQHPHNIIRLILGKTFETDTAADNRYTRSAAFFNDWLAEGVLVQDTKPAIYLTSTEFSIHSRPFTRWGMIAQVALEPFDKGVVLPHEKTFSHVKSERLELMKSCHANFSPIFSLYSDPAQTILNLLRQSSSGQTPDMTITDTTACKHRLWRILDPAIHRKISEDMAHTSLFIADGHHRYETALNYRKWIADNTPGFTPDHPANFIMMYLCAMEDPGLVILPTHRILKPGKSQKADTLIEAASAFCDIQKIAVDPASGTPTGGRSWEALLDVNSPGTRIGIVLRNHSEACCLTPKPGVMQRLFGYEMTETMLELDVTVLTRLLLMELLGLDSEQLDKEGVITYSSRIETALEAVRSGNGEAAFILNPTRIDQVKRIAESGETMPRKSTYFHPKVITGQVINRLI
jgi:uncharacterized protein (DUF1015 family)